MYFCSHIKCTRRSNQNCVEMKQRSKVERVMYLFANKKLEVSILSIGFPLMDFHLKYSIVLSLSFFLLVIIDECECISDRDLLDLDLFMWVRDLYNYVSYLFMIISDLEFYFRSIVDFCF